MINYRVKGNLNVWIWGTFLFLMNILILSAPAGADAMTLARERMFFLFGLSTVFMYYVWPKSKALALFGIMNLIWIPLKMTAISTEYVILYCIGIFIITALWMVPHEQKIILVRVACMTAALQAVIAIFQVCGWHFPIIQGQNWGVSFYHPVPGSEYLAQGWIGNSVKLGHFLALSVPLCLIGGWTKWLLIPIFPAIYLTHCLGGLFAALVGGFYALISAIREEKSGKTYSDILKRQYRVWRIIAISFVCLIITLIAINSHGWHTSYRLSVWKKSISVSWQYPFGHGPSSFWTEFTEKYQKDTSAPLDPDWRRKVTSNDADTLSGLPWRHAHNEFVQLFYEYGWLGLGLLVWFLVGNRGRRLQRAALITLLGSSVSFFTFHSVNTAVMGLLILGLMRDD